MSQRILSGVAPPHIAEALFATISYRLEPSGRATRFPFFMDSLYAGRLDSRDAPAALAELGHIEAGLKALPPERAVWSFTDLRRIGDSFQPVNHAAKNLYEYFIDADGQSLLIHVRRALEQSMLGRTNLTFNSDERRASVRGAAALLLIGLAWAGIAYLFFPDRILVPHGQQGGPLLWPLGLLAAAGGAFTLLLALRPAAERWSRRHAAIVTILLGAVTAALLYVAWRKRAGS